ncbi:MAG: D-glycero-beta-D-manno-heptose 1,7-bisphosphate 7-phosphatase [Thermoplasmata archaeon]|nr:D-glycero-beta-D-manno-heptose 1,7-bisphosphate 7-phosphatase [Thermoplasmata archaeon]
MLSVKQAVILAGGRGTRLQPLTDTVPKPMILMNGKPFLEYLIGLLKENGICEIVLLLGYLPEKITEYFGDGSRFGVKIKYSISDLSDETGTRIKKAEELLQEFFLLTYCDNYLPLDLKKLVEFHEKQKTMASVTIYTNKDKITKNNVFVDEKGYVITYDRTRQAKDLNGVDVGFFILSKKITEWMPGENFSFQNVIIPKLIENHQLSGYLVDYRYYSIGSLERLPLTERFLQPKKVIFLDRDGVINKKPPKAEYVKKWNEFEFLPGAIEALELLTKNGYHVYLITNQAGIARGVMTESDLRSIHEHLQRELHNNKAKIDGIYYCPHGWDENCECRKPKPGMFFQAARDHQLDLSKTVFIGDDERDLQAGNAAGVKTILVTPEKNLLQVVHSLLGSTANKRIDTYYTLFESLLETYMKSDKTRFIVSIAGCSRSGKTILAKKIQEDLKGKKIPSTIIPLDNWLLGLNERKGNETVRERYQYTKISETITRLKHGEKIYPPVYDSQTRQVTQKKNSTPLYIEEHGIGIIDGIVSLDIEDVRNLSDYHIYVDINDTVRIQRLKEFYIDYKKCSTKQTEKIIKSREIDEVPIIKKTKDYADAIYTMNESDFT